MRNLCIAEILKLLKLSNTDFTMAPWDQWSNRSLLEFYGALRVETETEEYDE